MAQTAKLPGAALLDSYIKRHGLTRVAFAKRVGIDRATIVNLIGGKIARVSVAVAIPIAHQTDQEVPIDAWLPPRVTRRLTKAGYHPARAVPGTVQATGTDG